MELIEYSDSELLNELKDRIDNNKKNEKEIERLNKEIKSLNKKLKESESLKSHFISNITNEIINPFSSIIGLSKNILLLKADRIDKIGSMAELIYSEAFDLDFQLRNIFAVARLESGEFIPEIHNVDVNSIIDSVLEDFNYKIKQKHITVKRKCENCDNENNSLKFATDPVKLRLIISNLVCNGIKFSNPGSKIELVFNIEEEKLVFSVKDYGIGIAKSNLKIIFDRFKRLNSTINSINTGHGLGLSIIKAVLDILEGDIKISSVRNQGSVFTVIIPQGKLTEGVQGIISDDNELFFEDDEVF